MANASIGDVLVDGEPTEPADASISVFDMGLRRGYGCFEAVRSYSGFIFKLNDHLDRLEHSAAKLGIELPLRRDVADWAADRAAVGGDCVIRIIVTGGLEQPGAERVPRNGSRVIVFAHELPDQPRTLRVLPVDAPWHPDGTASELTGAKTLSYAPNVAARQVARTAGFDDALLLGRSGTVLEGPTFGVAWVRANTLETPGLGLGILASITRATVIQIAREASIEVNEGAFPVQRLVAADEVIALSTVREVVPITQIGDHMFPEGPITARLAERYRTMTRADP